MGRLVVDEEGVSRGLAEPGRGGRGGVEEGSGTTGGEDVGPTALDLRLEPTPRPLKREFRELIRRVKGSEGEEGRRRQTTTTATAAQRRSRSRDIILLWSRWAGGRRKQVVAYGGALVSIDRL